MADKKVIQKIVVGSNGVKHLFDLLLFASRVIRRDLFRYFKLGRHGGSAKIGKKF